MADDKPKQKVLYEGGSFRAVCDGTNHFSQLKQADKSWANDHDIQPCSCTPVGDVDRDKAGEIIEPS